MITTTTHTHFETPFFFNVSNIKLHMTSRIYKDLLYNFDKMVDMTKSADELLAEAKRGGRGKEGKGYHDNKAWCNTHEILTLLEYGALPIKLNSKVLDGSYTHEVEYKGHIFQSVTREFILEFERYRMDIAHVSLN